MTRWKNEGQTCTIDGCDKPMRARRWCSMHYSRWRAYGDPEHVTRPHRLNGAVCDIDGCDTLALSKGLCKRHYSRMWKTGTTELTGRRTTDPEDRFRLDVDTSGDCHIWTGAKMPSGYGALRVNGKVVYAHRYAWERVNGPIPDEKMIDHACHNRACVNIAHLRLATSAENARNLSGPRVGKSTPRGVTELREGGFVAQVHSGAKNHYLGVYSTPDEAGRVAAKFRAEVFGEFAGRS